MNILDFDTIILDLDYTVWFGNKPNFWAKLLVPPLSLYKLGDIQCIQDINNDHISLPYNVEEFLVELNNSKKNVGFITRGGLQNTNYDEQPSVICLKMFGLLKYFNIKNHVLYKTDIKSRVITPIGKTIFIDDNKIDLLDIFYNVPNVTVYDRANFKNWTELLGKN